VLLYFSLEPVGVDKQQTTFDGIDYTNGSAYFFMCHIWIFFFGVIVRRYGKLLYLCSGVTTNGGNELRHHHIDDFLGGTAKCHCKSCVWSIAYVETERGTRPLAYHLRHFLLSGCGLLLQ